ncbi:tyrosine-type recombinase/integrase [Methylobacterium sp. D53M]
MSVFKRPGAETYSYDFQVGGRRFSGSTGATTRREAERVEERERQSALAEVKKAKKAEREPMTFEVAASLYWTQVGEHHRGGGNMNTAWSLAWLRDHIGAKRRLIDIDDALVAKLVAIRRGEPVRSGQNRKRKAKPKIKVPPKLVAPATVNRSVTEPLRKILNRAKRVWKEPVAEISWRDHFLREPKERIRELKAEEEARLFDTLRPDYHAVIRFALLTGLRLGEVWQLRWDDIDWGGRQVTVFGKGAKIATIPLPPDARDLLWSLRGDHPEAVFTYVVARNRQGRVRGERLPMTRSGLQTAFRRAMPGAQIDNFRFHDNRHTAATRILRATGNLRAVQRLLRHENIATTTKYAHVTDDDVMAAMQLAADRAKAAQNAIATSNPTENPTEGGTDAKTSKG